MTTTRSFGNELPYNIFTPSGGDTKYSSKESPRPSPRSSLGRRTLRRSASADRKTAVVRPHAGLNPPPAQRWQILEEGLQRSTSSPLFTKENENKDKEDKEEPRLVENAASTSPSPARPFFFRRLDRYAPPLEEKDLREFIDQLRRSVAVGNDENQLLRAQLRRAEASRAFQGLGAPIAVTRADIQKNEATRRDSPLKRRLTSAERVAKSNYVAAAQWRSRYEETATQVEALQREVAAQEVILRRLGIQKPYSADQVDKVARLVAKQQKKVSFLH